MWYDKCSWIRSQLKLVRIWNIGGPEVDPRWAGSEWWMIKSLKSNLKGNWWFVASRILSFNIHLINFSFDRKKIWCGNKSTIVQSKRTGRIDRESNRIFNVFLNVIMGSILRIQIVSWFGSLVTLDRTALTIVRAVRYTGTIERPYDCRQWEDG